MLSPLGDDEGAPYIFERDYYTQLRTVHSASILFYRRSEEVKHVCNTFAPEVSCVRSASEVRHVARLLSKSASATAGSLHPKFAMIVAEVDHTIIKFMEVLHKYYDNEGKMSARLPLLLLIPQKVEEDFRQYAKTCDVAYYTMDGPFSPRDVFALIVVMLHRRHVADDLYTKLTKTNPTKHISETKFNHESSSTVLAEATSSLADDMDEEELIHDVALSNTAVSIADFLVSSKQILQRDAYRMRDYYIKELQRNNIYETLEKYAIDSYERSRIDEMILKNLNKGIAYSTLRSGEIYETLALEVKSEVKEDEKVTGQKPRVKQKPDPIFRAESCNILSESYCPALNVNDSTDTNMFESQLMPFVERPRPDMSRPRTVAGLYQRNAKACWSVLKTKSKLNIKVEHKHDRPWSTPFMKSASKPITDDQGTMTLEAFLKIKDYLCKQDGGNAKVMEEAIPVDTQWKRPKKHMRRTSQERQEAFKKEVAKTKRALEKSDSFRTPPTKSPHKGVVDLRKDDKIVSTNSLSDESVSTTAILGAARDWRGVVEEDEYESDRRLSYESVCSPRKLSTDSAYKPKKLSTMLRSTGGLNFGVLVTSSKARAKAKRMVNSMAISATQDPETSRLLWVNLDNRRVSAFDRDNLSAGIAYLSNGKLENAYKSFSKAILVCKQVHIAMIYRGIVQYQRGKFFNALEDFTNASKNIESSNMMIKNHMEDILIARFIRGITYFRLGDDEPGLKDLKFALAVNPANVHVREMLMQVQRRSSNYLEAVEHCLFIKKASEESSLNEDSVANGSKSDGDGFAKPPSLRSNSKFVHKLKRSGSAFDSFYDLGSSTVSEHKAKTVDVNIKNPESHFPGLQERKLNFLSMKAKEYNSQNSMFLENFKHANGFKRHMFDTHFIRLNEIQEALLQKAELRTMAQKYLLMRYLRSYSICCDLSETSLLELACCVEYRVANNQNVIFHQDEAVDAVVLVLTGQLQLRLEGQGGSIPTSTVAELNQFDMYGHFTCIFNERNTGFLQKLHQICLDAENGIRSDFSPQQLNDTLSDLEATASFNAQDLPRALQPASFMTCKVASPTEMILIKMHDFNRLLRRQTEIQFFKRLELLKASGIFSGDFSYYDLVRLGRMCVLRRYKQGETILSQGEVPDFVFFILKGICKAMKRPDPTEYLSQRLITLRKKADKFEELYTYHHSLRSVPNLSNPSSEGARGGSHHLDLEMEHKDLRAEIARLEVQEAREIVLEQKRREEEKELRKLGHDIPDRFVDVSSLHWPQIFGEAAILQPDTGVSAGTIIADTNCHLMCMHKSHIQTFAISKKIVENVKDRMVVYPSHEKLVIQLADKEKWHEFKSETLDEISKEKWPGCQAAKPQNFNA